MNESSRARSIAAWSVFGIAAAMAVVAGVLWVMNERSASGVFPPQIFVVPGFGLVGAIIASRSRNIIGPLFLALAFVGAGTALTFEYAVRALGTAPGSLPLGGYGAALSNAGFPFTWLALGLTLVWFPDGHLPSTRWRIPTWSFAALWGLGTILSLFVPTLVLANYKMHNPVGIGGPTILIDPERDPIAAAAFSVVGFLLLAVTASAPVVRRRRASAETRQQLRWFALVLEAILLLGLVAVPLALIHAETAGAFVASAILVLVALGIPAAIGIAVLRYRLYELDVVVNKTVLYAGLAAFITLVYVGVVVGLGTLTTSGRASVPLSIAATAIVAVAFQPVRERLQRFANRIVYGKRSTPYEVLTRFSDRVGSTYANEDVLPRTVRVIAEGVSAERATIWLRLADELRPASSWPEGSELPRHPVPLIGDDLASVDADHVAAIRYRGELLGAITIDKPPSEPMRPEEVKLIDDLAAQAGLVVSNVRLTADLEARLAKIAQQAEQLKASRQRIVAAQDEERRRLERNIHDGAQQHLVALAVKLRLARALIARDPEKAATMLREITAQVDDAIETLRTLALGIYPPLLEEHGVAAALAAQYQRSDLPVHMSIDGTGRYPIETEAAVYFCLLEALQNAAKYAHAGSIEVRLNERDGSLTFEVTDDGVGFDRAAIGDGTGLGGMRDRLAVLGGDVELTSRPGHGTTVRGRVPLALEAVSS